jgi:hypothetical protein
MGKKIPGSLMPVISDNYGNFLSWSGAGKINDSELKRLDEFIRKAHAENKKVRLWGGPDKPEVWGFLLEKGVDFINTDKLENLAEFLVDREKK